MATAKRHVLNNFVGEVTAAAAVAAAAPPRIRPTALDTNDRDGTEMLAHIFMRVPIVVELCEADLWIIALVRHPPAPKVRRIGEDKEEQGAIACNTVGGRCWVSVNGELDVVATLPKAVTGAINVRNSNWVVNENFAMINSSYYLYDRSSIIYSMIRLSLVESNASYSINRTF